MIDEPSTATAIKPLGFSAHTTLHLDSDPTMLPSPPMASFTPKLHILPPSQRQLWPELAAVPTGFTLYGGTALALRLAHRTSVDFDLFSNQPFDPDRLSAAVSFLRDAERVQVATNTLTCRIDRGGPVLVSLFGGLGRGGIAPPDLADDNGLQVASLLDIAATMVAVVQKRAAAKDYIDIDALLSAGIDLPNAIAAARAVHGPTFNPMITLKALSYFGDVTELPRRVRTA